MLPDEAEKGINMGLSMSKLVTAECQRTRFFGLVAEEQGPKTAKGAREYHPNHIHRHIILRVHPEYKSNAQGDAW